MFIEIVSFPTKNVFLIMVIFHSYVSLPEGKPPFSYGFPMVFPWFPILEQTDPEERAKLAAAAERAEEEAKSPGLRSGGVKSHKKHCG